MMFITNLTFQVSSVFLNVAPLWTWSTSERGSLSRLKLAGCRTVTVWVLAISSSLLGPPGYFHTVVWGENRWSACENVVLEFYASTFNWITFLLWLFMEWILLQCHQLSKVRTRWGVVFIILHTYWPVCRRPKTSGNHWCNGTGVVIILPALCRSCINFTVQF